MTSAPASTATDAFGDLPLSAPLLLALERLSFTAMTPIQAASLPFILAGRDIIARAKTGSGKTAAFALGTLQKIDTASATTQALILCPTRELADQVAQAIRQLAQTIPNLRVLTWCGGVPIRGQVESLQRGAHIAVGTPGRVLDLLDREALNVSGISTLVLDEADRMVDMGFYDDIARVASHCPPARQTLLFSATYPENIRKLTTRLLRSPQEITVDAERAPQAIMQKFFEIDPGARHAAVVQLLSHFRPESALAFCNTKAGCRELTEYLHAAGISALALHGDLEQRDRDEVLVQFTQRSCVVLVATDVAARGLDIADLAVVINVEVSPDQDVHVHRIGRTGRADRTGVALTLCAPEEMQWATQIESFQSTPLQWAKLADYPADVRQPLKASMMTLLILGGKRDKLRPGDVLGALTGEAGLSKEEVGKIAVGDAVSYVAVARAAAGRAMEALANGQIKGKKFRIRMLGVDGQGRPADGGKAEAGIPKPARTAAKPGDRAATGRAGGDRPQRNAGAGGGAGAGSGAPSWSKPQARSGSGSGAPRRDDGRPRTGGPTAQKRSKPAR